MMKILFIASEGIPLVKVGGLADVVGSLPGALNKLGHDVRLMLPGYGFIDAAQYSVETIIENFNVQVMKNNESIALRSLDIADNIKAYLVDNALFTNSSEAYGKGDLKQFFLFCKAVLEILPRLDWQPDIVHCHDWHTALIPLWLKRKGFGYISFFTIHNLAFQGPFDDRFLADSGLYEDWQSRPVDAPEIPLNFISQGILWADMVTTVSETYAAEILTPEYGEGLDRLLHYRREKLFGIINGLDYVENNPATDDLIAAKYDSTTLNNKTINKVALQQRVGLPQNAEIPLIGMVSRLHDQKGVDIIIKSFDSLFQKTQAQMIILGKGSEKYHKLLKRATKKYSRQLAVVIGFDNTLAHLIYAGCDLFLLPSRFEPCGLGQLIAMRYGSVPVVRCIGGLADTVQNFTQNLDQGSGFVFQEYHSEALLATIQRALYYYRNQESWQKAMRRIMNLDFSWDNSAEAYDSLYNKALERRNSINK
jgi:starch synthase